MRANPRVQRLIRLAAATASAAVAYWILSHVLQTLDALTFNELSGGFSELFGWKSTAASATELQKSFFELMGALLLCGLSVWSGYKLRSAARLIICIQLVIVSSLYQWLCFHLLNAAGHPLSLAIAIAGGCALGVGLKLRDDERRQVESQHVELKLRHKELTESRLALVKQDEAERRLLAADLHDQVLQDLRLVLKKFEQFADTPDPALRREIVAMLQQSMTEIREIMDDLCPTILSEFGLPAAIEDRLDKAAQVGKLDVRFIQTANDEDISALSQVEQQLVYRLVQESVTNVCKHAQATVLKIGIDNEDGQLVFRISDNGKGLGSQALSDSSRGTLYMRLRAALIGAKVSWKNNTDGKGTVVEIRLQSQRAKVDTTSAKISTSGESGGSYHSNV